MRTILSQMPPWASYIKGQDTLKVGYPWLALGAILTLERIVEPTWRVLELGSGGSTLFWGRRCAHVQSYETDRGWADRVREAVKGLAHVVVTHCATAGEIAERVAAMPSRSVDLVLVDHADPARKAIGRNPNRLPLTEAALPTVKPGGWVIVDNYDSFGMKAFDWSVFAKVFTFDEAGGLAPKTRRYSGRGTRLAQVAA